jgi:hypothetical protein
MSNVGAVMEKLSPSIHGGTVMCVSVVGIRKTSVHPMAWISGCMRGEGSSIPELKIMLPGDIRRSLTASMEPKDSLCM